MRKRSLSRQSSQRISLHGRKRHRTFRKSRYEALEDRHLLAHPAATTNFSVNDTWAQIGQDIDEEASLQDRAEEETRTVSLQPTVTVDEATSVESAATAPVTVTTLTPSINASSTAWQRLNNVRR